MKLRGFVPEDADRICSWIRSEKSLYQWSGGQFDHYPITGRDLVENYETFAAGGGFYAMCALEGETPVGHFFLKTLTEPDTLLLGYVVVDDALRGQKIGQRMLRLAIDYAGREFHARRLRLLVFRNNPGAMACYEAVGFRQVGPIKQRELQIGTWDCLEMARELD